MPAMNEKVRPVTRSHASQAPTWARAPLVRGARRSSHSAATARISAAGTSQAI